MKSDRTPLSGSLSATARILLIAGALLVVNALPARSKVAATAPTPVPRVRETRYVLECRLDYDEESLVATARMTLANHGPLPVREVPLLLHRLLTVAAVHDGAGAPLTFTHRLTAFDDEPRRQVNAVTVQLARPLPPNATAEIVIRYEGYLSGYVETGERYVKDRIDPAFTILRPDGLAYPTVGFPSSRSHRAMGLGSFDYEATIDVPESLQVANGGKLVERKVANGRARYVYRNLVPCWRMDFAIARYRVLRGDTTSVFCFLEDSANGERVRDAVLRSMRLFSGWFGPTKGPANFSVIEIPNGWGSQQDVTCILQTAAGFEDARRSYEIYHEVSHRWGVTARDSFPPRIDEGLATYLEDVASERIEGAAGRVRRTHTDMVPWLRGVLEKKPRYRKLAMKDYGVDGDTDLSYSVGFLMFEVLHGLVGDAAFGEIIGGFHQRYHDSGATTAQFVAFAKEHSPVDLTRFFADWYDTTGWQRLVRTDLSLEDMVAEYRTSTGGR
jgi:hypothetical protein